MRDLRHPTYDLSRDSSCWRSVPNTSAGTFRHQSGFVLRLVIATPVEMCYALYYPADDDRLHGGLAGYFGGPDEALWFLTRAVRALRRAFVAANDRFEAQNAGWEADRGFDGGEWSDRFHAQAVEDLDAEITTAVARRFGLTADGISVLWSWYASRESMLTIDACQRAVGFR